MNPFLKLGHRLLLFAVLTVGTIAAYTYVRFERNKLATYRLPEDAEVLILGNSHIQNSVDPSEMKGVYSVARYDEPIELNYAKARLFIDANPNIKTVILGMDHGTLFTENLSLNLIGWVPEFPGEFSLPDWKHLISNRSAEYFNLMAGRYLNEKVTEDRKYALSIGRSPAVTVDMGYWEQHGIEIESSIEKEKKEEFSESLREHEPYEAEKWFIRRLKEYLDGKGIKLIFFAPPVHPYTLSKTGFWRKWIAKNYPEVPLYDFSQLEMPDSCFFDITHLNVIGSRAFSRSLTITPDTIILHRL